MTVPAHRGRRDNGLSSEAFAPVADVDPRLGDHLLDVLGLRDIPAYVEPAPTGNPVIADRLFVASGQTAQARSILNELANELGIQIARDGQHRLPERPRDLLAGLDTDAEFAAIIADMPELDRPLADDSHAFILSETFDSTVTPAQQGVHDDTVEHFVPPPAPPLPRLTAASAIAVLVTIVGVAVIALGSLIGMPPDLPLPLGVLLVLFGSALLFRRLREDPHDDADGDGAVV